MMNNETTNPIESTSYVDLDMMIDAEDAAAILVEAREYATEFAQVPTSELVVAVVNAHGSAGGWPVVRFMADSAWLTQLIEVYDAEAEGEIKRDFR